MTYTWEKTMDVNKKHIDLELKFSPGLPGYID